MTMTDPIADMLTRIRNGLGAKKVGVTMPASRVRCAIAKVLAEEGYISGFSTAVVDGWNVLTIGLKYYEGEPVIETIRRVSTPGRRVYKGKSQLPSMRSGLGVTIVSTSRGIMTDRAARSAGVGGEVLCVVM